MEGIKKLAPIFEVYQSVNKLKFLKNTNQVFAQSTSVKVYDYLKGKKLNYYTPDFDVVDFYILDNYLLLIGHYGEIDLYDYVDDIRLNHEYQKIDKISATFIDQINKRVVIGTYKGKLVVTDYTGAERVEVETGCSMIASVAFNEVNQCYNVIGIWEKGVYIYDKEWKLKDHLVVDKNFEDIKIKGEKIALLEKGETSIVHVYNKNLATLEKDIQLDKSYRKLAWHPTGKFLMLESYDEGHLISYPQCRNIAFIKGSYFNFSLNGLHLGFYSGEKGVIVNLSHFIEQNYVEEMIGSFDEPYYIAKAKELMIDIPNDFIEFLETKGQFDSYQGFESGKLLLKSYEELELQKINFSNPYIDIDESEYENWEELHRVEAISLTSYCENYDSEFILCYLPKYKLFGAYDNEHGELKVFRDTTWTDILKNPAIYVNAGWDSEDEELGIMLVHSIKDLEKYKNSTY